MPLPANIMEARAATEREGTAGKKGARIAGSIRWMGRSEKIEASSSLTQNIQPLS
jgi:hypothetical protein